MIAKINIARSLERKLTFKLIRLHGAKCTELITWLSCLHTLIMTANKCVRSALWPGRGEFERCFAFKDVLGYKRHRLSFQRYIQWSYVCDGNREGFLSRKYLMVIECDYTGYYNHWPPVRVFRSDGMYPPPSPWKREAFHLGCIRYFKEGLLSADENPKFRHLSISLWRRPRPPRGLVQFACH